MLLVAFLQWWYGPGWRDAGNRLANVIHDTYLNFSIPILIRTMFAPWRRIVTAPGGSLQDRLRSLVDNAVSRCVGFVVRLLALIMGCGLLSLYAVFGGLFILIWPALPLLGPALIVGGLI
jgi:hypothetical protein